MAESAASSRDQKAPAAPGTQNTDLLTLILKSLDDDKAEDVLTIDLRGKTEMADFMVVATGRSTRQVSAIAEKLSDRIKQATGRSAKMEGLETGDWVLIDCGDAVVHIFRPEVRDFYQLEKMWLSPEDQLKRTPPADA
ncbi:ribosome silencing factor [Oceanibium sediminis]|uniref:ribosome silencing factor n=1 Tax=Oceanibium sediminis TaxID=2026339 RepID=UPI000DD35A97